MLEKQVFWFFSDILHKDGINNAQNITKTDFFLVENAGNMAEIAVLQIFIV